MTQNKMSADRSDIEEFWRWFVENHMLIQDLVTGESPHSTNLTAQFVTSRVAGISSSLGWEAGANDGGFYFAFTLNGDVNNAVTAERVVELAPLLYEWSFIVGKPPKRTGGHLVLMNTHGQSVFIDSSNWKYVLTGYDGGAFFDIQLIVNAIPRMDGSARSQVGRLVIDEILGERLSLEKIARIEIIDEASTEIDDRSSNISDLRRHLEYIADHLS